MNNTAELDVLYVAQLARLDLNAEETALFRDQLQKVLEHVDKLKKVDVTGVEPTSHAVPVHNIFREDKEGPCFAAEEALGNAPAKTRNLFIVPKVVE
jgi:aspartyl-tRNA(Asn)/glutamyl-tRNA(Gln) amidotransferase subunit C